MAAVHCKARWGILFGGTKFVVLYFRGHDVFISDIIAFSQTTETTDPPNFEEHLPYWSTLLYTVLSTAESDEALLADLQPVAPFRVAIPEASTSQEVEMTESTDGSILAVSQSQLFCCMPLIVSNRTRMSLFQWSKSPTTLHS